MSRYIIVQVVIFPHFLWQGLIVNSQADSLQHFKKLWAHEHEPVEDLLGAVKVGKLFLASSLHSFQSDCLCLYFPSLIVHLLSFSGTQAHDFDWISWSRKSFHKGGY